MPIRIFATIFAVVLALQSAWIIAPEIVRPTLPFFPVNSAEAKTAAMALSATARSAEIGWPRGELWIDYAMAENASFVGDLEEGVPVGAIRRRDAADSVTESAAALAPSDARAWLLLAAANSKPGPKNSQCLAKLKMSYYTSSYNERFFPLRLQVAAQSPIPPDDELRGFIDDEIGRWLRARPDQKRPIALAYRNATPAGRQLLEASIGRLDPKLLSELQGAYH